MFLPRESHGQRSLEGFLPWGHKKSLTLRTIGSYPLSVQGQEARNHGAGWLSSLWRPWVVVRHCFPGLFQLLVAAGITRHSAPSLTPQGLLCVFFSPACVSSLCKDSCLWIQGSPDNAGWSLESLNYICQVDFPNKATFTGLAWTFCGRSLFILLTKDLPVAR